MWGQSDLPASVVRSIIGGIRSVGVSAREVSEAEQAVKDGADYLGVGAMFPTDTKTDARPVTMEELRAIRSAADVPIVVIGGLIRKQCIILRIPESTAWRSYPLLLQQRTSNRRQERWYQNSGVENERI